MILVTGATGHVGRHVVFQLLETGAGVRAITRDPASAGLPAGVDVRRGDLTDPATLEEPLDGVESVFLLWSPDTTEAAPTVVETLARRARHIVYVSSLGVRDDCEAQADPINASHAELEHLIEQSAPDWTFLRPSGFATNTLGWASQIRAEGVVRFPYGAAARSLIHERDVAAVAVRALTETGHGAAKHRLTGPQSLTQAEQAHTIGEAIGRPVRWEEVPREAARAQLVEAFGDASVADGALDAWAGFVAQPEPVTSTVEEITGTPARTLREWATDHAEDFR